MSTTATAKRRRRQAKNGYKHLCEAKRPHYIKRSTEVSKRRLELLVLREQRMKAGKKTK